MCAFLCLVRFHCVAEWCSGPSLLADNVIQQRDLTQDLIAYVADTQRGLGAPGPTAGLGTQEKEAVDALFGTHIHYVSITSRLHAHHQVYFRVCYKCHQRKPVTQRRDWGGEWWHGLSDCKHTQYNLQQTYLMAETLHHERTVSNAENAPSGAKKIHWASLRLFMLSH